jgi:hypothetical protein
MSQENEKKAYQALKDMTAEKAHELVEDSTEEVTLPKWEHDLLLSYKERVERAERPVRVKVKDAIVSHRRQLVIAGVAVATLGAAAYAATHKDILLEGAEVASETAEHGARDVKKTARKARTGSTSK